MFTLESELTTPVDAHGLTIEGSPEGTTFRASEKFHGRALLRISGGEEITIRNIHFDGNRAALKAPIGLPPDDTPFATFYRRNAVLAESVNNLQLQSLAFLHIADMAILVSRSHDVRMTGIHIDESGSLNALNRNNATGGILFEEGTSDFQVLQSVFTGIRGNAVWTHSWHKSPRNLRGLISQNKFQEIGRDAIQVGHATEVTVAENTGSRIGFPSAEVDVEGGGTPVAIDTAGNVDHSVYRDNRFTGLNGKCIDLDGFHDGQVLRNICRNADPPETYPFGHYGIVFNNTNPAMRSEGIVIKGNEMDGLNFGGIFVIGRNHVIEDNRLLNLNRSHCNDNTRVQCIYFAGEPDLLRSGIYFGLHAERPDPAQGNIVRNNVIQGYKMKTYCLGFAPGVSHQQKDIAENQCSDR